MNLSNLFEIEKVLDRKVVPELRKRKRRVILISVAFVILLITLIVITKYTNGFVLLLGFLGLIVLLFFFAKTVDKYVKLRTGYNQNLAYIGFLKRVLSRRDHSLN
jgi:hypothetical protein